MQTITLKQDILAEYYYIILDEIPRSTQILIQGSDSIGKTFEFPKDQTKADYFMHASVSVTCFMLKRNIGFEIAGKPASRLRHATSRAL